MPTPIIIGIGGDLFSAVAEGNISGGAFVKAGSYTSTVTALSAAQYDYSKIKVSTGGSGLECVGLALYDRASGTTNEVAVLRRGTILIAANGNVQASRQVEPDDAAAAAQVSTAANAARGIGRALTTAASGGFCIVNLNL